MKRKVYCYLGINKKVRLVYYNIDGNGDIQELQEQYTLDNVASALYEYYLLHVIKKNDYVDSMCLFVEAPYLYFDDIYKLGIKIGEGNIDSSRLSICTINGGEE